MEGWIVLLNKLKTGLSGNIVFSLVISVLGLIWIISGLMTGLWDRVTPAGGFMLAFIGVPLVILGISVTMKQLKDGSSQESQMTSQERRSMLFILIAVVIGSALMNFVLGTIVTLTAFIILWLKLYAKFNWWKTALISICVMLVIYGMFVIWLQVRFPTFLNLGII